jgi:CPA2 family monovalent cation:H+ antiporter-2
MTAKDSLLIATSLIAMGEFAFIIAKAAFDAGVVNEGFYSAVIGAALITMMVMPIMTKRQPKMFDHISKLLPERVRCSLARIDDVHTAVAMKNSRTPNAARAEIKKLISLIFVDILIALMVMIFFTNLERFSARLFDALSGLLLLPSELLMLILIIVMAPIVYNMYSNVRAIARVLTKQVMESSRGSWMNERGVYLMFANLGTIALVLILLLILLPFIPQVVFRPVGVALVGLGAILILYLSWDTVKRAYDRFCKFMASEPEREEKENP